MFSKRRNNRFDLILLILLSSLLSTIAYSEIQLRIEQAKVLGVWLFAKSIAEVGQRQSTIVQDAFNKSDFSKDPLILKQIEVFRNLHDSYFVHSYSFESYPKGRDEMSWDINRHFDYQAAKSKDLSAFSERTAQLLPQAEQAQLFRTLATLLPVYEALIWSSNESKLKSYEQKILETWKKGNLSELFVKTSKFYRATWPENLPVTIYLIPVPGKNGHTTATVIQDAVLLESLTDEADLAGRVGVVFHELCHAIFEAESAEVQTEIESWFVSQGTTMAGLAYSLLNEGLATAIGNGFAYKNITGAEDTESWYSVDEIDQGAKAESSLVRDYIQQSKPIDSNFVKSWIETYQTKFPNALRRFDIRMREVLLLTDGISIKPRELKAELRKGFRISSAYSESPINHKESSQILKEVGKNAAWVFAFSSEEAKQIKQFAKTHKTLVPFIKALPKKAGSAIVVGIAGEYQPVLLLRIDNKNDLPEMIKKIKELAEVPIKPKAL